MRDSSSLFDKLKAVSFEKRGGVPVVPQFEIEKVAKDSLRSRSEIQKSVLDSGFIPERFSKNLTAFSLDEQRKICSSKIALVGLGGLGGHVLELLSRAGVGNLKVCDGDFFESSNLNRQLLSYEDNIGQNKARAACERVYRINSAAKIESCESFLSGKEFDDFLKGCDIAVDCLGGADFRNDLKLAAKKVGIPLVTAGVAGWSGMISTVMPGGLSPFDFMENNGGSEDVLGTQSPGISLAAGMQCSEILRIISGRMAGLSGKVLIFDLMKMYFDVVSL